MTKTLNLHYILPCQFREKQTEESILHSQGNNVKEKKLYNRSPLWCNWTSAEAWQVLVALSVFPGSFVGELGRSSHASRMPLTGLWNKTLKRSQKRLEPRSLANVFLSTSNFALPHTHPQGTEKQWVESNPYPLNYLEKEEKQVS